MQYGYKKAVGMSFDEAVAGTIAALGREGFGILMDIDVQAKLLEKTGKDIGRYRILGACNPAFAAKALEYEKEIGLFLPCNVIVYEDEGKVFVSTILPSVAMNMIENEPLHQIATEAENMLRNVIDGIGQ